MDSHRWCAACKAYGDHHTDRHPVDHLDTAEAVTGSLRQIQPNIPHPVLRHGLARALDLADKQIVKARNSRGA